MRVSEAKSSGLFGNGARLPAILSDSVVGVAVSIQWRRVTGSYFDGAMGSTSRNNVIVKLLAEV